MYRTHVPRTRKRCRVCGTVKRKLQRKSMLHETRALAGRGQAPARPGQDTEPTVTDASADVRALGGANVSTSMKQKALVDDASTPGLAQPGLASSMVSSKKPKVEPPLGVESTLPDKFECDVRKSQLSHSAFQIVGAGMDCRGEYPPMDPVRLQQQALPLGVGRDQAIASSHRRDRVASCCFV